MTNTTLWACRQCWSNNHLIYMYAMSKDVSFPEILGIQDFLENLFPYNIYNVSI